MIGVLGITGPAWYQGFLDWLPDGKLFSIRAVFDALPSIIERLPITIGLTLAGAFFGLILGLVFAIVKINRVRFLYPVQAVFVSFLRGTPILVQLMLTYYGIPLVLEYQCYSCSCLCDYSLFILLGCLYE